MTCTSTNLIVKWHLSTERLLSLEPSCDQGVFLLVLSVLSSSILGGCLAPACSGAEPKEYVFHLLFRLTHQRLVTHITSVISIQINIEPHTFFLQDWIFISGLHICKAGALPLESWFQSILLWLFFEDGVLWTIYVGWLWTTTLPISVSQVARITGISHCA
jgi:hypothetical protein